MSVDKGLVSRIYTQVSGDCDIIGEGGNILCTETYEDGKERKVLIVWDIASIFDDERDGCKGRFGWFSFDGLPDWINEPWYTDRVAELGDRYADVNAFKADLVEVYNNAINYYGLAEFDIYSEEMLVMDFKARLNLYMLNATDRTLHLWDRDKSNPYKIDRMESSNIPADFELNEVTYQLTGPGYVEYLVKVDTFTYLGDAKPTYSYKITDKKDYEQKTLIASQEEGFKSMSHALSNAWEVIRDRKVK